MQKAVARCADLVAKSSHGPIGNADKLSAVVARLDSFYNDVTGMGTARDKTTYGRVQPFVPLEDETISSLLHVNDMAERMVSIVPAEMLREGFNIETGKAELDTICEEKCEALSLREKLFEAIWGARGYGGGALVLGADDGQDAALPLDLDRVKGLEYVHSVDRRYLNPVEYYDDPEHPKFGTPSLYSVTIEGGHNVAMSEVHESRLVIFRGAMTGLRERRMVRGWDLSVLQRPHNILRQFDTGWSAVETMLTDANQAIFKMTAIADIIATPGGEKMLTERVRLMDMFRSFVRAIVVDADSNESFERQAVSFENIPQVLEKFMLRLAASVQIPVTILMGQSPAGMNATGDADFRWFYNRIRAEQTLMLGPRIRRIMQVWLRSKDSPTKGRLPDAMKVKFPSLWTETPLDESQRRKVIAETDAIQINAQMFTPDELALLRSQPDGFNSDLVLSEDAIAARKAAVAVDLERIKSGDHGGVGDEDAGTSAGVEVDGQRFDANAARMFELHRDEDETGVSGTGVIADGVVFPDGSVVLKWKTATSSTTIFKSVDDMLKVHGHAGKTRMVEVSVQAA